MMVDTELSQELMLSLPGRVGIPLNYNVIDIAHQICLNDNRVSTYCVSTSVLHTAACVPRTHDDARHRTKPRTHLPNLPGRVRIPFNYNTITLICVFVSMRIRGYTRTVTVLHVY